MTLRIRPSSSLALAAALTLAGGAGMASAATIFTPADGETYELGAQVFAAYACADPCVATAPPGGQVDTGTVGSKTFTALDADGLATSTYQVADTVPPNAGNISLTLPGATGSPIDVTVTGNATDAGGGLEYGFSLSGTVAPTQWFARNALPDSYAVPGGTADGPISVFLWARDASGNAVDVDTATTTLDRQDPIAPTPAAPADGVLTADDTPALQWTAGDGTGTSITQQWLVIDGNKPTVVPPAQTGVDAPSLSDGTHTWAVRVQDAAGNVATGPARAIRIDSTGPAITITSPAAGSEHEYGSALTAEFACDGTGSAVIQCVGPTTLPTNGLGVQRFTVEAADEAGNTSDAAREYEVVDTIDPGTPMQVTPAAGVTTNDTTPTFSWQPADELGGSPIAGYVLRITGTGGAVTRNLGANITSFTPTAALAAGDHQWRITARDQAGNEAQSPQQAFTIDVSAPPAPQVTFPASPTNDTTPSLTLSGVPGATFLWQVSGATELSGETQAGSIEIGPLSEGDNLVTVTQRTPAGNEGDAAAKVLRVDLTGPAAPAITSRPDGASTDTTPGFAWSPREGGGTFEWNLRDGNGAPIAGGSVGGASVELGPLGAGSFSFQVRQIDAAGNPGGWAGPIPFTILPPPDQPGTTTSPATTAGGTTAVTAAGTSTGAKPGTPQTGSKVKPATSNTSRLKPSAGSVLTTVRPRLRWKKVRGATLYNVQVFRMKGSKFTKVHSVFPRAASVTIPRGRLAKGERYVWRVWSFKGRKAASKPIGVSYFDVAAPRSRAR